MRRGVGRPRRRRRADPRLGGVPGATDGTIITSRTGIPSVVYGPGGKWIAHQADEFVEVDDLHHATPRSTSRPPTGSCGARRDDRARATTSPTSPASKVGHHQRTGRGWLTGTTVVLPPPGTVGGVDVRGGGPGTRETDPLHPLNMVSEVDGICLTGGSAYGLDAAGGVMAWLEQRGRGFRIGHQPHHVVPIVPAAVIFDLGAGGVFAQPAGRRVRPASRRRGADRGPSARARSAPAPAPTPRP